MRFARAFAAQLAHPRGLAGRLLGQAMDLANRRPTRLAIDYLAPQAGETILDAGCGTGEALAEVMARVQCATSGIDASRTMISAARRRLGERARLCLSAIEDMPFGEAAFDAVLALNVLYFADKEGRLANAFLRQLKHGGRLVVYVTHRSAMSRWRFARAGVHRLFDEADLVEALVAGGFVRDRIAVHPLQTAPGVAGLIAVAFKMEATNCPRFDLQPAKLERPAG